MTKVLKHPYHPDEAQDRQDSLDAWLTNNQMEVNHWLSDWECDNYKLAYRNAQITDVNQDTAEVTFWFEKKEGKWQFLTWITHDE